MAVTVVISGSGRGAGKTAVGCALIQALAEWAWTAVKITPDIHPESAGSRDSAGEAELAKEVGASAIPRLSIDKEKGYIEKAERAEKSTERYLAAGARRAVLVTVPSEWKGELLEELDAVLEEGPSYGHLLVESNRFTGAASISLAVTGVTKAEWKQSFLRCVDDADALVLTNGIEAGDLPERLRDRRMFVARERDWAPAELVDFVRERLRDAGKGGSRRGGRWRG